uniref:HTH La-type RNA-binding domain-containing protein n=1 Tax=Steinernema glaseri TaxID=37863 RepID=A0A1I8A1S7_9BILA
MSYSDERNGYIESRPPSSMADKTRFSDFVNDGLDSREEAKSSLLNNRATEEIPTLPNSHVSEIPASPNCSLVDSTTTEDIPTLPNSHVTEIPASPSCSSANDAATEGICSSEEPLILTRETFISMVRELRHCTLDELKARFNDTYGLPIDSKLLNLIFGCSCRSVLSAIKVGLEGVVEVDGNVITVVPTRTTFCAPDNISPVVDSLESSPHTSDDEESQCVFVDFKKSHFPSANLTLEVDLANNAEISEFLSRI